MTTQDHITTAVSTASDDRAAGLAHMASVALNSINDPLGLSLRREARNRHWATEMEVSAGDGPHGPVGRRHSRRDAVDDR